MVSHVSHEPLKVPVGLSLIPFVMKIIRLAPVIIIFTGLAFGLNWQQIPNGYTGLVQDNQGGGGGGGNCQDGGRCATLVRPKPNCFAQKAAKVAKEASDAQIEAGAAAALQVQKLLADKAASAAKAAEAAYVSKQQLVGQIESELCEGRQVVQKERARLLCTKATAADARQGVNQAAEEVKALTEMVKKAQGGVAHLERVVAGSQQAVANQKQAVAEARERLELLLRQVEAARADYQSTKAAAQNAACAAQEARQRAGRERRMSEIASYRPTFQRAFYLDQAPPRGYSAAT